MGGDKKGVNGVRYRLSVRKWGQPPLFLGRTASTLFGHYMTSTPCGDFASGNCKIYSQGLRILHGSAPRVGFASSFGRDAT